MASAGRKGYQFNEERKVWLCEVQWEEIVFGHVADAQRILGGHTCESASEHAVRTVRCLR